MLCPAAISYCTTAPDYKPEIYLNMVYNPTAVVITAKSSGIEVSGTCAPTYCKTYGTGTVG